MSDDYMERKKLEARIEYVKREIAEMDKDNRWLV
jgi:hypothetical protein